MGGLSCSPDTNKNNMITKDRLFNIIRRAVGTTTDVKCFSEFALHC